MKKIYISADIEGIWGNSNPAYTMRGGAEYEEYRTNMINEVNLVISALFENGVEEIIVNDGHGNMDNLLPSRLDPRVSFVSSNGAYKPYGMMEGFDDSYDGVCFIGYHCRSNTAGIMAHTNWGAMIRNIKVDGMEMGEAGINARLAWEYGVPVILVSGDNLLKQQIEEELGKGFSYVETKKAINSQCALCCSWNTLMKRYQTEIPKALTHATMKKEVTSHSMEITFHHERNAAFASRMDNVIRIDNCTVRIEKDNYDALYRMMRFIIKTGNAFA